MLVSYVGMTPVGTIPWTLFFIRRLPPPSLSTWPKNSSWSSFQALFRGLLLHQDEALKMATGKPKCCCWNLYCCGFWSTLLQVEISRFHGQNSYLLVGKILIIWNCCWFPIFAAQVLLMSSLIQYVYIYIYICVSSKSLEGKAIMLSQLSKLSCTCFCLKFQCMLPESFDAPKVTPPTCFNICPKCGFVHKLS